jgi:hypothetical protein
MTALDKKTLIILTRLIEKLEAKQVDETITFEESATMIRLIDQAEYILSL